MLKEEKAAPDVEGKREKVRSTGTGRIDKMRCGYKGNTSNTNPSHHIQHRLEHGHDVTRERKDWRRKMTRGVYFPVLHAETNIITLRGGNALNMALPAADEPINPPCPAALPAAAPHEVTS